jgi:hypothetical protein
VLFAFAPFNEPFFVGIRLFLRVQELPERVIYRFHGDAASVITDRKRSDKADLVTIEVEADRCCSGVKAIPDIFA